VSHSVTAAIAVVKLLPPGFAVVEIRRRLKDKELTPSDILPIAQRLAENKQWYTVDKLTTQGLLGPAENAELRKIYPQTIRPTFQLLGPIFRQDLATKKVHPQAISQIALAESLLRQGCKESSLLHLLRVVEGILTDLCLLCLEKLEERGAELESKHNLKVNKYEIENQWGMYAKSIALKEIGVLSEVEYADLYEDLNEPRNKMFHSYVGLPEREVDILVRHTYATICILAAKITSETEESTTKAVDTQASA